MVIEVKKRENESLSSLLYRFQKKVKQSGILKEARARQFYKRRLNRNKRRLAALYRVKKEQEIARERKYGHS